MKEKKGSFFSYYLGGDVFSKKTVVKQLPFLLYVVFLLMIYISNTYIAEDMKASIKKTSKSIEEKRIENVMLKSELTSLSRQPELAKKLKKTGIKEATEPAIKIVIEKNK